MRDWTFDGEWETHKTGMLVSEEFPQAPIAYVNLHLAAQPSYLSK